MAVDRDLFLYDLAVVAIMKNEAPYVKEWLDYHLAAGVDHFFIYDNESPDNFKEVLQPYIDAGIVTYKFYPGTGRQVEAYTEAYKAYRFFCRYIAFIDADEFIFPQSEKSIVEVTDEIFNQFPNACSLGINWIMYGSNNLETADYSRGVLERFTRRAEKVANSIKTIFNPRQIKYMITPHYSAHFFGTISVMDDIRIGAHFVADRILINHYRLKSREEFLRKYQNSSFDATYGAKDYYSPDKFTHEKNNDVFDDSILKYRDSRPVRNEIKINYELLINTLFKNLQPILSENASPKFLEGIMENFLTCRALASHLKNLIGNQIGEILEQVSLSAILMTAATTTVPVCDAELLLSELPNILILKYPEVKEIHRACLELIPKLKDLIRSKIDCAEKFEYWRDFNDFDNLLRLLKVFDSYQ